MSDPKSPPISRRWAARTLLEATAPPEAAAPQSTPGSLPSASASHYMTSQPRNAALRDGSQQLGHSPFRDIFSQASHLVAAARTVSKEFEYITAEAQVEGLVSLVQIVDDARKKAGTNHFKMVPRKIRNFIFYLAIESCNKNPGTSFKSVLNEIARDWLVHRALAKALAVGLGFSRLSNGRIFPANADSVVIIFTKEGSIIIAGKPMENGMRSLAYIRSSGRTYKEGSAKPFIEPDRFLHDLIRWDNPVTTTRIKTTPAIDIYAALNDDEVDSGDEKDIMADSSDSLASI